MNEFKWGISDRQKDILNEEINVNRIYETFIQVKEGDIVLDLGATTGDFICSIQSVKPKHIYALEPSKDLFPFLIENTEGLPITCINKALSNKDGEVNMKYVMTTTDVEKHMMVDGISFQTLLKEYNINHIDFMKTDCEGGEYSLFREENILFLLDNVTHIAGEFHLGSPELNAQFVMFRNKFLSLFDYQILDVSRSVNITEKVFTDHFINFYKEVLVFFFGRKRL